jgi:threonine dehydrogenase-like Zn-dependent dehydrogenase
MRATVMYGAGDVRVEDVADARLIDPTDALVRVTRAAICGSDLWPYKSMPHDDAGRRMGHEFIGVIEAVGSDVDTVKVGDVVVSPFLWSDGSCVFCREGLQSSCLHGGRYGDVDVDGGQGEAVRVPQAEGTLVVLPVGSDDALMPSLLTLTDVMGTGHHAALTAKVGPGKTVAVVGDGAVGLCGVIASKRLGAERILLLGSNPERTALGQEFGATDVVRERGEEALERVRELTQHGAHSVLNVSVSSRPSTPRSRSPVRAARSVASASPSATLHPPALRSGRTLQSPAALHPSAPISRRCCPTCSKVGSSPDVSSTAPDRSKTCRAATAR